MVQKSSLYFHYPADFELFLAFNTVNAPVCAITYHHKVYGGQISGLQSLTAHPDVQAFFRGDQQIFSPVIDCVPAWDLPNVLNALKCSPFESHPQHEHVDLKDGLPMGHSFG